MFKRGKFDVDRLGESGFAVDTKIDCIANIMVDVDSEGHLIFTCGDWESYNELRDKLNQVTASMRSLLQKEGLPRYKYSNLT